MSGFETMPKFKSWVSLTAGKQQVDLAQNPAIISARVDTSSGRLGDLTVVAHISPVNDATAITSIVLTDTGTLGKRLKTSNYSSVGLF